MTKSLMIGLMIFLGCTCILADDAKPIAETTVGMGTKISNLILPGTELEAKLMEDRKSAFVVRILAVYQHGSAFRYDFEFQGLEPGVFDLRTGLQRKDRSATSDLPVLLVKVNSLLPAGQVKPHGLEGTSEVRLGGYGTLITMAAVVWILGLVAILLYGRKKNAEAIRAVKPVSLAEKLRPLVEAAMARTASATDLASLERSLLGYWRRKLNLNYGDPSLVIQELRSHPEAGPLLSQLEIWLHHPAPAERIDPVQLLAPYRSLPPDVLEEKLAEQPA